MMTRITNTIERYSFGVCAQIGRRMGIKASTVRLYFIYSSFIAFGSPLIIYLVVAFWANIKKSLREANNLLRA